jgi:hypothetical protein
MNRGLWLSRKNYLQALIKKLSNHAGGDDDNFLREHTSQTIEAFPDERIEQAIKLYTELLKAYER